MFDADKNHRESNSSRHEEDLHLEALLNICIW